MSHRASQAFTLQFLVRSATGGLVNADALPLATLVRNGVDQADAVTVTNVATGIYRAASTLPTAAVRGDLLQVRVTFAVSGTSTADMIHACSIDHDVSPDEAADAAMTGFDDQGYTPARALKLDKLDRLPASGTVAVPGDAMALTAPTITSIRSGLATAVAVSDLLTVVNGIDISVEAIDGQTSQFTFTGGRVHARVEAHSSTALAEFATVNTGQASAVAGSVAKLSQGSGGGSGGAGVDDLKPYFQALCSPTASTTGLDLTGYDPTTDSLPALFDRLNTAKGGLPDRDVQRGPLTYYEGEVLTRVIDLETQAHNGLNVFVTIDRGSGASRTTLQPGQPATVSGTGTVSFVNLAAVTAVEGFARYTVWHEVNGEKRAVGTGSVRIHAAAKPTT